MFLITSKYYWAKWLAILWEIKALNANIKKNWVVYITTLDVQQDNNNDNKNNSIFLLMTVLITTYTIKNLINIENNNNNNKLNNK